MAAEQKHICRQAHDFEGKARTCVRKSITAPPQRGWVDETEVGALRAGAQKDAAAGDAQHLEISTKRVPPMLGP